MAKRLCGQGWYTGFLKRDAGPQEVRWLGGIVSQLLVVVDYAEAAKQTDVTNLLAALRVREQPACVLLTAVDTLDDDHLFRDQFAELLTLLLPADPGDGSVAIRPDPAVHRAARSRHLAGVDRKRVCGGPPT